MVRNIKLYLFPLFFFSLCIFWPNFSLAFSIDFLGGDCGVSTTTSGVVWGSWNASGKTCTLVSDVDSFISLDNDGITLDGNGYKVSGSGRKLDYNYGAVLVEDVNNITVKNISAQSYGGNGLIISSSTRVVIENIDISNSNTGIRIDMAFNTKLTNSKFHNNQNGIYVSLIKNSYFRNNRFDLNVNTNTYFSGSFDDFSGNDINTSNTADGKVIYYVEDADGQVFNNLNSPEVFLCIRCKNITLSNSVFNSTKVSEAVYFYKTDNSTIKNNTITGTKTRAVTLFSSANTNFIGNNIFSNPTGLNAFDSPNSVFKDNIFQSNQYDSIEINSGSLNSLIKNNTFDGGWWSILSSSNDLKIIQNNFLGNGVKPIDSHGVPPIFSEAVPIGGNYWADYDSDSEGCLDTNLDGICDSAKTLTLNSQLQTASDNFPWTKPSGWLSYVSPEPLPTCCSNVLFLPGLEASRLYMTRPNGTEDQLWEPNTNSDVEDLYLNSDGTSKNNVYTKDVIDETNTPFTTGALGQNIYKSFSNMMDKMVSDGKIESWKPYPYDWRQDVNDVVTASTTLASGETVNLTNVLENLVKSSKDGKVMIVSHSNGGLVAKAFLKKLQDDKNAGRNNLIDNVDTLVLVAVPEIGTAVAVPSILHGYDQKILSGLLMNESTAREFGRNMKGAYGLLPSKEYLNRVNISPVTFKDNTIPSGITSAMVQNYGNSLDSYDKYKNFLFGSEGRKNPEISNIKLPIILSSNLFYQAESLHNSIDNWVPPASLKIIEVAGWGLDTVASFEYYPQFSCSSPDLGTGKCGYVLDERPRFTSDGDKTVVVPSAQYMSFKGNAEKWWVDINEYNKFRPFVFGAEHKNILEIQSLLSFVKNNIVNNQKEIYSYLSTTSPIYTGNRLRLSIHSPVTIDAYDSEGNHTGKICSTTSDFCYIEENIPNSSYLEFGEGKYLNLPEENMKNVKLLGTDIGTFTYQSEEVLPNNVTNTTFFHDIPVTPQTIAIITADSVTKKPQLDLDVDGDGKTDFTVQSQTEFDPILYLQIMKSTIDSLDLNKSKIKEFDKKVDQLIQLIKKGKVNKAKLRVEQFVRVLQYKNTRIDKNKENELRKWFNKYHKTKKLSQSDAELLLNMLNQLLNNLN